MKLLKDLKITDVILTIMIIGSLSLVVIKTTGSSGAPRMGPGAPPGMSSGSEDKEILYTVIAEEVVESDMENYIKLNGDVTPNSSVDLYPDISGELTKLFVSLGDYVKKNQTIAEIDPSQAGQVYSASPVKSTIAGTIIDLPYEIGSTISSTTIPVASVGDLSDLLVEVYVSEKEIAPIQNGLNATIQFDSYPESVFHGVVTEISPVLDKSSRTMEVKISLQEKDSRIKSGMYGSVKLITEELTNVRIISQESLIQDTDGDYVFIVKEGNKAYKQMVETGLIIDGQVQIISGLSAGDQVVNRGQSMLRDGALVQISQK